MNFSKSKFFKLDTYQQNKKCAQLLKEIYEFLLHNREVSSLFNSYNLLASWMKINSFYDQNLKNIADRYHWHLQIGGISLKEHNLLPSLRIGDREAKSEFLENAIFLDNIRSAYNVGSILRTTEALRLGKVYFSKKTPYIDNLKVVKTAMGSADIVPTMIKENLEGLPSPIIALDTSDKSINIFEFIFPEKFTLILGNEEYGISDELLKKADYLLEIPMLGCKNSINVACAFAIAAAQIRNQHTPISYE
jgi:tRNA G18 (ribose-2'-O)-methylase SpoU